MCKSKREREKKGESSRSLRVRLGETVDSAIAIADLPKLDDASRQDAGNAEIPGQADRVAFGI